MDFEMINSDDVNLMDDLNADEEAAIFEEVEGRYTDHVISVEEVKKKLAAGLIEKIDGFDYYAGRQWIYPIDREIRDYQLSISHRALFNNTLVVLPTGLGKTLIAAVVMYNIYRWYPQCKIIFMAPTRPLVKQQVDACYHIVGIPKSDIIELTGQTIPSKRKNEWESKRLFFLTPQVVQNDLFMDNCCDPRMIKCIVVDEAHRATGDYAYTKVVQKVYQENKDFRVLALSATPGSNLFKIKAVLKNLLISKIDFRTEESIDVVRYTYSRKIEKIIVKLDNELIFYKTRLLLIIEQHLSRLKQRKALGDYNLSNLSSYYILKQKQIFEASSTNMCKALVNSIRYTYSLAVSLIYSLELMLNHGLRTFYNHIKSEKHQGKKKGAQNLMAALKNSPILITMMESLKKKFEIDGNVTFRDEDDFEKVTSVPGHPKLVKLQEIVLEHFNSSSEEDTRVMIFSQYRDSVEEIVSILRQHEPTIRPMAFVGQNNTGRKKFTQKQQLEVVNAFREGKYNTLVATSVAEEGLDIGNVDLIICYDSSKSPVRLVQRIGRTGRKRDGKIVILVTEGREEQSYKESVINKRKVIDNLLSGIQQEDLFKENVRLVPRGLNPTCSKRMLAVKDENSNNEETSNIKRVKRKLDCSDSICESTPRSERNRTKSKKKPRKSKNVRISENYDINDHVNDLNLKDSKKSEDENEHFQNSKKLRTKIKNKDKSIEKSECNNLDLNNGCYFFDHVFTNNVDELSCNSHTLPSIFKVSDISLDSKSSNQSEQASVSEEKSKNIDETLSKNSKYSKSLVKKLGTTKDDTISGNFIENLYEKNTVKIAVNSKYTNLKERQISDDLDLSNIEICEEKDDSSNKFQINLSEHSLNNTEYVTISPLKDQNERKDKKCEMKKLNKSDNADIVTKKKGIKIDLFNNTDVLSKFKPPKIMDIYLNSQNQENADQNSNRDVTVDLDSKNLSYDNKHLSFKETTKERTELYHLEDDFEDSSLNDDQNIGCDSYMELEDSPDHPNHFEEKTFFKYEYDESLNSKKQLENTPDDLNQDRSIEFDDFDEEMFMLQDVDFSISNKLKVANKELEAPISSTPNKLMESNLSNDISLMFNKNKKQNKMVFPAKQNENYKTNPVYWTKNSHIFQNTIKKRCLDLSINPFSLSKKKSKKNFPADTFCQQKSSTHNNWEIVTSSNTNKNCDHYKKLEKNEISHQLVNKDKKKVHENQNISSVNTKFNNYVDNLSSSIRSNDLKDQENDEDLFNDEDDELIANLVLPGEIVEGSKK